MCMSVCLHACMYAHRMCAWGSQSRLDPLGVMLLLVIGCWELYLDPLQAQQVLLTAETSFHAPEFSALQKFWFVASISRAALAQECFVSAITAAFASIVPISTTQFPRIQEGL